MRLRKLFAVAAVFAAASAVAGRPDEDKPDTAGEKLDPKVKAAIEKLVGTYAVQKGEKYGGKPPAESVKDITVKVSKDKIVSYDASQKEVYVQTFKVTDVAAKPMKITMKSIKPKADVEVKGLIELKGDTLRLIYALPGGDDPTEFKTKEKQLMFTMKKAKAKGEAKKKVGDDK